jgi:hypothetical protein
MSRGGALLKTRRLFTRGTEISLNLSMAEGTVTHAGLVLRSSISFLKGIPQYHAAVAFDRPLTIFNEPLGLKAEASQVPTLKPPPSGLFSPDRSDSSHEPVKDGDSAMIAAFLAIGFYHAPDATQDDMSSLNDW